MTIRSGKRCRKGSALLAAGLISISCAGHKVPENGKAPVAHSAPAVQAAVYKARAIDENGRARRFRLRLAASPPDRLHAEVIAPVGGTRLVLDGGRGRMAVTVVAERIAFVGPSDRRGIRRSLGLDISLADLVGLMLEGRPPGSDIEFERVPPGGGGWPARLVLSAGEMRLELQFSKSMAVAPGRASGLFTGKPPAGVEIRPLESLSEEGLLLFPGRQGE